MPNGYFKIIWDLFIAIILSMLLFTTSIELFFNPEQAFLENELYQNYRSMTFICNHLDVILNFFTGNSNSLNFDKQYYYNFII